MMTNFTHQLADAIREVTIAMQKAIADGYRSRIIVANDLVEVLLLIADRLDPPVAESVTASFACPECGERHSDRLVWLADEFPGAEKFVRCDACGTIYSPGN